MLTIFPWQFRFEIRFPNVFFLIPYSAMRYYDFKKFINEITYICTLFIVYLQNTFKQNCVWHKKYAALSVWSESALNNSCVTNTCWSIAFIFHCYTMYTKHWLHSDITKGRIGCEMPHSRSIIQYNYSQMLQYCFPLYLKRNFQIECSTDYVCEGCITKGIHTCQIQ